MTAADAIARAVETHERAFRRRMRAQTAVEGGSMSVALTVAEVDAARLKSRVLRTHLVVERERLHGVFLAVAGVVEEWQGIVDDCRVLLALRGVVIRDGRVETVRR